VINRFDGEIELGVVPFEMAAELAAAVSQHAQDLDADIAQLLPSLAHQDQESADEQRSTSFRRVSLTDEPRAGSGGSRANVA
jgi:hypothetical protein